MKKHNDDKKEPQVDNKEKPSGHNIETPVPPQVMNPSLPPSERHENLRNDNAGGYTFGKRKIAQEQISREEL